MLNFTFFFNVKNYLNDLDIFLFKINLSFKLYGINFSYFEVMLKILQEKNIF